MAYKVFTNGSVLNASEVNENLMQQAVATFSNAAARTAAITSPVEGQVTYLEDVDLISIYESGAWRTSLNPRGGILQVVQTVKTDTFTSSTTTFVPVTGLSATITPKSASSKILVLAQISYGLSTNNVFGAFRLYGGATDLYIGDAASNRTRAVFGGYTIGDQGLIVQSNSITYLASPNSTSAQTIGVEVAVIDSGSMVYVNRSKGDSDADIGNRIRGASSITLMEVSA